MASRCSGGSNAELVANLVSARIIQSKRVEEAMLRVDRKHYVRPQTDPYEDSPQLIGYQQMQKITAPHMHAECLERLEPFLKPGANALDLGSGSGYLTAAFKHMVGPEGKAFGVEYVEELVPWAIENVQKDGFGEFLRDKSLQMVAGDGSKGWPEDKTLRFSAIHVGAAAPTLPKPLVDALASPGRMVIPVGVEEQVLMQVDKDASGAVTTHDIVGVRYVPFHMTDTETFEP